MSEARTEFGRPDLGGRLTEFVGGFGAALVAGQRRRSGWCRALSATLPGATARPGLRSPSIFPCIDDRDLSLARMSQVTASPDA